MKKIAIPFLAVAAGLAATPTLADENRPLKCRISAARASQTTGPALVANVPSSMTPIDLNSVLMTDKPLWKSVIVEGLFARRTEMDTLEVTARFVNCTKVPIAIQARSSFMDEAQVPTEQSSVWKTIHIGPRSTGVYQERSISGRKVSYYLVELRSSQ